MITVHITEHRTGANGKRCWFIFRADVATIDDLSRCMAEGKPVAGVEMKVAPASDRSGDRVITRLFTRMLDPQHVYSIQSPFWRIRSAEASHG